MVQTRTVKNLTEVRFEVQTIGGTEPSVRFEVRGVPAIAEPVRTGSNRFEPIIIQGVWVRVGPVPYYANIRIIRYYNVLQMLFGRVLDTTCRYLLPPSTCQYHLHPNTRFANLLHYNWFNLILARAPPPFCHAITRSAFLRLRWRKFSGGHRAICKD
jgi:hypothetical protein